LTLNALRRRRARWTFITAGVALAVAAALIGLVLHIHATAEVSMGTLTRDPLSGKPAYLGLLSQMGILVWAASAATCLLAAGVLRGAPESRFLFGAGILSLVLCLDDAFLLHDEVLPLVGVPEELIYAGHLGIVLVFLVAFRRQILRAHYPVLLLALGLLGVSVVCDAWGLPWLDPYLLEDGAKFAGITMWTAFFSTVAGSLLGADRAGGRAQEA